MGEAIFVEVVVGTLLLWIVLRPANQQDRLYTGEILSVLAVVLFSGALVTAMRSYFLESLFGGIDLLYRRHRISATLGAALLPFHVFLTNRLNPIESRAGIALEPGAAAVAGQAFGMFGYRHGGREQIWIAGGIGITPFLSWIRAFPETLPYDIDLYYSVRTPEDALFRDEIEAASSKHPSFRLHLGYSSSQGKPSVADIERTCAGAIIAKDIYMCGPTVMTTSFHGAPRKHGLASQQIRFEDFNFR
jgi:predicted ferric reductase